MFIYEIENWINKRVKKQDWKEGEYIKLDLDSGTWLDEDGGLYDVINETFLKEDDWTEFR